MTHTHIIYNIDVVDNYTLKYTISSEKMIASLVEILEEKGIMAQEALLLMNNR